MGTVLGGSTVVENGCFSFDGRRELLFVALLMLIELFFIRYECVFLRQMNWVSERRVFRCIECSNGVTRYRV